MVFFPQLFILCQPGFQISSLICRLYQLCKEGKEAEVREQVQRLPKAAVQNCARVAGNEEGVEEEEEVRENTTVFFVSPAAPIESRGQHSRGSTHKHSSTEH